MTRTTVEPFDATTASDDDLAALFDLYAAELAEYWPEDPVDPFEQWAKERRHPPSWRKVPRWVVRGADGRAIDGVATLDLNFTETNRDHAGLDVYVRPERRRAGLARDLLRPALDAADVEGRTLLDVGGPDGTIATAFCEAMGAARKSVERKSRMVLDQVDRSMLEDWVARAAERASGYSLLAWDGPCPDEYLERFVQLTMVMNTAPRDDLEMDDWVHTPERHRESEQRGLDHGFRWWTLVTRHDDSDELAGYTEFVFSPAHPHAAWQEATAVDPKHRDKGLGRWLKATNALRLLDERPDIRYVDTWNAFSNGPMLGINIAMGFEIINTFAAYQIETAALLDRLALRR